MPGRCHARPGLPAVLAPQMVTICLHLITAPVDRRAARQNQSRTVRNQAHEANQAGGWCRSGRFFTHLPGAGPSPGKSGGPGRTHQGRARAARPAASVRPPGHARPRTSQDTGQTIARRSRPAHFRPPHKYRRKRSTRPCRKCRIARKYKTVIHLAGQLHDAPAALIEALLGALDIQVLYRPEQGQATIWATLTGTTPATITALLHDPRVTASQTHPTTRPHKQPRLHFRVGTRPYLAKTGHDHGSRPKPAAIRADR
jgi:hypothetical protein